MNHANTFDKNDTQAVANVITLDSSISFEGEMTVNGQKTLVIEGSFTGSILAPDSEVRIENGAVLTGTVFAHNVAVAGTIRNAFDGAAQIEATGLLSLEPSAKVRSAQIRYGAIVMQLGAAISGDISSIAPREAQEVPQQEVQADSAEHNEDTSGRARLWAVGNDPLVAIGG